MIIIDIRHEVAIFNMATGFWEVPERPTTYTTGTYIEERRDWRWTEWTEALEATARRTLSDLVVASSSYHGRLSSLCRDCCHRRTSTGPWRSGRTRSSFILILLNGIQAVGREFPLTVKSVRNLLNLQFCLFLARNWCLAPYMLSPIRLSVRRSVKNSWRIMKFSPYGSFLPLVFAG